MRSIASLDAQNRFGEMLDTSQREPVLITRRGRPVSLVLSPANDIAALRLQFARAIGELAPLRGPEASAAMETTLAGLGAVAEREGLTDQAIARMADAGDDDLLRLHPWRGVRIVAPAAFVAADLVGD